MGWHSPDLPGVAPCSCIQSVPAARRCSAPLVFSTTGTPYCLLPFSNKHSTGRSLLRTCGRKKSSSVSQERLSEAGKKGVLFVHTPCRRPQYTCNILERNVKQAWLKKDPSTFFFICRIPGDIDSLALVLRKRVYNPEEYVWAKKNRHAVRIRPQNDFFHLMIHIPPVLLSHQNILLL